jgi:hypothetical protein
MDDEIFGHVNQFPLDNLFNVATKLMRQATVFIISNEDGFLRF